MNREETLAWIEDVTEALDKFEMMAMIEEMVASNELSAEFFETLDTETERLKADGDMASYEQLLSIARTVAIVRQNRKENL